MALFGDSPFLKTGESSVTLYVRMRTDRQNTPVYMMKDVSRDSFAEASMMRLSIRSARLQLSSFTMADAEEVFYCITPGVARYMRWEPPQSLSEYKASRQARLQADDGSNLSLVVRRNDTMECLGIAGLDGVDQARPELGIWLKEAVHGQGYGGEAVRAVADWAAQNLGKKYFLYPVAVENFSSRRIAEKLNGEIIGRRTNAKYESVVYQIPALTPQ